MTKYDPGDIKKVQDATNILIDFLNDNKENIVEYLKKNSLESFQKIILVIFKLLKENHISIFQDSPEFEIHKGVLWEYLMNCKVKTSTIEQGIGTMTITYLALFCISKGLGKEKWSIKKELFLKLPQTSLSNVGYNDHILGLRTIKHHDRSVEYSFSTQVFLVKSHMLIFQDGICPFMRGGVIGKKLNQNLSNSMLDFLELLYSQILIYYERDYRNSPTNKTPDFVNVLLGRFEIDEKHLQKYSQFFQKI